MRKVARFVLNTLGGIESEKFKRACQQPMRVQESLLKSIIREQRNTAFGKDHSFDSITSIDSYQRSVPACTYEDHEPYLKNMLNGEPMQLTRSRPILFSMTSGTTGERKYIPVTEQSRKAKSQVMRIWLHNALRDHPKILDGRILSVVSPETELLSPGGIPCGSESGHAYRNMPSLVRQLYIAPHDVFSISDYDAKYYVLLRMAVEQDVSVIATCNPSTIIHLCERMDLWKEQILKDIHDGTLNIRIPIPDDIRANLKHTLMPNPVRAKHLEKRIHENNGILAPNCCWQKLVMVSCWKAGSVKLYLLDFPKFFPQKTAVRDWGYLASELRGSIPLSDHGAGGVLTITSNFFEFLPEDEIDSPVKDDKLLTLDQLSVGERYYVFITTLGGLYRYEMNDLVEVTGFFRESPEIQFVQKRQGFSSITGEKLYEDQVVTAVQTAMADNGSNFEFLGAVLEWAEKPRYAFLVEFSNPVNRSKQAKILMDIEHNLQAHNFEYSEKRASGRLAPPSLKIIQPGESLRYRKERVMNGSNDGQFKTLKLTDDQNYLNEFAIEDELCLSSRVQLQVY